MEHQHSIASERQWPAWVAGTPEPGTLRWCWLRARKDERREWCRKIGTSYGYLQKLSWRGSPKPGLRMALKMQGVIPGLDMSTVLPVGVRVD